MLVRVVQRKITHIGRWSPTLLALRTGFSRDQVGDRRQAADGYGSVAGDHAAGHTLREDTDYKE